MLIYGDYAKVKACMISEYKQSDVCLQELCEQFSFPELSFMEQVKLYGELCEMMDGDAVIRVIEGADAVDDGLASGRKFVTMDGILFDVQKM